MNNVSKYLFQNLPFSQKNLLALGEIINIFSGEKDQLEISIADLQIHVTTIKREIEKLEEKIRNAKSIQQDLDQLNALKDYMPGEISKVDAEKSKSLTEPLKIKEQIEQKLEDPSYLSPVQLIVAQLNLEKAKHAINSVNTSESANNGALESLNAVLEVQQKAREELECVVCLEVPDGNVFSCSEQHILCSKCKQKIILLCPICRQNFTKTPPTRNKLAEKMILKLK